MRNLRFIQVFNRYLNPGGEEKSVARIASDLETGGHIVERFWKASEEWTQPGGPARWRQPFLMWRNGPVLDELATLHREFKADAWILHNIVPVISLGIYRLACDLNVPIVQWLHNYRPISPSGTLCAGSRMLAADDPWVPLKEVLSGSWNGRLQTAWLAWGYRRLGRRGDFRSVAAWIPVSEEMRRMFARAGRFRPLFTLRHSWHIRPAPETAEDDGHFLFLGRMVESKGVRFLIDLWRHPALAKVPLVMAGQGPLRDELEPHTPPQVRWIGHVEGEEKKRWLSRCRAVVFPSTWAEPLSTVAYEAYEMKKPILASDLGGMKEIVFDNQTGAVLPAGDSTSWETAILSLANDPGRAERLGAEGRRWLEQNVSTDAWNRQFGQILSAALPL